MLYIRVDMNNTIATGHVRRCLSIADAARSMGQETTFLLADQQAVGLLTEKGYSYIVLNTTWNDMEGELPVLREVIREYGITSLLIDSYMATEGYLKSVSELTQVTYIDDLNELMIPKGISIVCYANYSGKFNYPMDAITYSGTRYTPLRQEFLGLPPKQIRDKVDNVLIISGGTDNYEILKRILEKIPVKEFKSINAVCGIYSLNYEELKEKYAQMENVHIYKSLNNIIDYMRKADVVISAGGTTLYELCAIGVPTITYSMADNQIENVKSFARDGIMEYAGDIRYDNVPERVNVYLSEYCNDIEKRRTQSEKMQQIVDGEGAIRIANILRDNAKKWQIF